MYKRELQCIDIMFQRKTCKYIKASFSMLSNALDASKEAHRVFWVFHLSIPQWTLTGLIDTKYLYIKMNTQGERERGLTF